MNVIPGIDLEGVHQLLVVNFGFNTKQKLCWRNGEGRIEIWKLMDNDVNEKLLFITVTKIFVQVHYIMHHNMFQPFWPSSGKICFYIRLCLSVFSPYIGQCLQLRVIM
jgi:hypothetical protein